MEQSVKERIIIFMKRKGLSHKKFENAAGLSNGYVGNLRHSPSADKLSKILGAFPELNRTWLLTGEGEMLNRDFANQSEQKSQDGENQAPEGQSNVLNKSKKYDLDVEAEIAQLRHEVEQLKALLQVKNDEINFYRSTIASALKGKKDEE